MIKLIFLVKIDSLTKTDLILSTYLQKLQNLNYVFLKT